MFNNPKLKYVFCGVDTHRKTHTVSFVNCFFEKMGEITVPNTPSSFNSLLEEAKKYCLEGMQTVWGLEDTGMSGRSLAVFLVDKQQVVKTVNSKFTNAERKALPIYEKTDSFDSLCVARVLISRFNDLPDAKPVDLYWSLKMLVSRRNAIVKANTALKNQIHAYILHHYPSYQTFFNVFDCPTALAFWEQYPSPGHLQGVTADELAKFLRVPSSGMFGLEKASEILEAVERDGNTKSEYQETRDFIIVESIKEIRENEKALKKIEREMRKTMNSIGCHLESMVGIDLITASGFMAEIGEIQRFSSADKLAKFAGISPVTYASGDKEKKFKNRQGNRRLYHLFHSLAARSINCGRNKNKPVNDIFYEYYQRKISQGKTEHQALICVMRRLVNIIYGLLKNKSKYVHPTKNKKVLEKNGKEK